MGRGVCASSSHNPDSTGFRKLNALELNRKVKTHREGGAESQGSSGGDP